MNIKTKLQAKLKIILVALLLLNFAGFLFVPMPAHAAAASLSLIPNAGSFVVDSTFDVSVYLDTQSQSVNTIEINLRFPQDKLQLVSSSTGKSIIGIWTSLPKFNNQAGTVNLVGGIPGGVNVSRGLISTFTFRVKAVGSALIKFENSRVLLNDGLGTEVLTQSYNSIFDLTLPPPAGPVVISDTHPDQTRWYRDASVSLRWGDAREDGFSYVINSTAIDTPDDISEGKRHDVVYKNLTEGRHYFHIRALRNGVWGGTTHYALNIDPTPPAEFQIEIVPDDKTSRRQPVIQFASTDSSSGLDHYELKIVPLSHVTTGTNDDANKEFFIEAQSPYISNQLELGKYDVIVRAYDKAGNYREQVKRMDIVNAVFKYVGGEGVEVKSWFIMPWYWLWILLVLIILLLIYFIRKLRWWHWHLDRKREQKEFPVSIQQQMEELQKYRSKYGKLTSLILAVAVSLALVSQTLAQEGSDQVLAPPVITTVSKNISDEEIFYVGGQTGVANVDVLIYLQSLESSATVSQIVKTDKNGEWFYRHNGFLSPGNYLLWTQTKLGNQSSVPSPQISLSVETTAIQFGATRVSYVTLYLVLTLVLAFLVVVLLLYILHKFRKGHKKHQMFVKEISEAEASIRRGFAVLNRDIQAELDVIRRAKLTQSLSAEEKIKEEQLLNDLAEIEQYVSKEIWDIEEVERTGKAT